MRRVIVFALLLAAATVPTSVESAEGSGCGGTWLGSGTCEFVYEGFEVSVTGEGHEGVGVVSLEAPGPLGGQPRLVLRACPFSAGGSCASEGGGYGGPIGTILTCRATGVGSGTYFCGNVRPEAG